MLALDQGQLMLDQVGFSWIGHLWSVGSGQVRFERSIFEEHVYVHVHEISPRGSG